MTDCSLQDGEHQGARTVTPDGCAEAASQKVTANAIRLGQRAGRGHALRALGSGIGLTSGDIDAFERLRDSLPAEPLKVE